MEQIRDLEKELEYDNIIKAYAKPNSISMPSYIIGVMELFSSSVFNYAHLFHRGINFDDIKTVVPGSALIVLGAIYSKLNSSDAIKRAEFDYHVNGKFTKLDTKK